MPPQPFSIRLDPDLRAFLERQAELENRTLAGLIIHLLREHQRDIEFEQT